MKFILLVEMPKEVTISKRVIIKRQLKKISFQEPKRNVFLIESERMWIIAVSDQQSRISYYQIIE